MLLWCRNPVFISSNPPIYSSSPYLVASIWHRTLLFLVWCARTSLASRTLPLTLSLFQNPFICSGNQTTEQEHTKVIYIITNMRVVYHHHHDKITPTHLYPCVCVSACVSVSSSVWFEIVVLNAVMYLWTENLTQFQAAIENSNNSGSSRVCTDLIKCVFGCV